MEPHLTAAEKKIMDALCGVSPNGLDYATIAASSGIPIASVRTLFTRMRDKNVAHITGRIRVPGQRNRVVLIAAGEAPSKPAEAVKAQS